MYRRQLAEIHHHYFTELAREAAAHLLGLLEKSDGTQRDGSIVELACGGGVSSKILADAGYSVVGVDASELMLELARAHAPNVALVQSSLWDFELPSALRAVTAIGEAFCYRGSQSVPTHHTLEARLYGIFAALTRGGVLLFDVATAGRSGPTGRRHGSWERDETFVFLDETENSETSSLERIIDTFVPAAGMHRHEREVHRLTLFDAARVEDTLRKVGFRCRQLTKIGSFALLPGWVAFEAIKP
jgi:SAM-dependent methyltransferase